MSVEWLSGFTAGMVAYALIDAYIFPRIAARLADRRRVALPVRVERRSRGGE